MSDGVHAMALFSCRARRCGLICFALTFVCQVGQFFIDALSVYYEKNHEWYNKWVALSAPEAARKSMLGNVAPGGVQGYLR